MPSSSTTPWPHTNPNGYEAWKIQHSIPRSVFEYYSLRSLGLIQARSDEEWEHEISGYSFFGCCIPLFPQLADGGELRIKVRFERVDWNGSKEMRGECEGVEVVEVAPPFLKREQRKDGKRE